MHKISHFCLTSLNSFGLSTSLSKDYFVFKQLSLRSSICFMPRPCNFLATYIYSITRFTHKKRLEAKPDSLLIQAKVIQGSFKYKSSIYLRFY